MAPEYGRRTALPLRSRCSCFEVVNAHSRLKDARRFVGWRGNWRPYGKRRDRITPYFLGKRCYFRFASGITDAGALCRHKSHLVRDILEAARQKIRQMGKNAGGSVAESAPHLRRAYKSVAATCRRWFDSPGGGHEPLIVRNSAAPNLPLAARPGVGHIGLTGDVAEWLKAAVC
jgi:hypothetical protein